MRIVAIMPIRNTSIEWQQEAIDALANQRGRGINFDLDLVRVFREETVGSHPRVESDLPTIDLSFQFDEERPTPIEQCAVGMEYADTHDYDFMFCLSSNDVYEPDYLELCLKSGKPVSYGDVGLCDDGMIHNRMIGTPIKFDPEMIARRLGGFANNLPDCALVDMSIYREFGFDTMFHRNSFHIFWIKIWEKYGSEAFANTGRVGFWMRGHSYHNSLPGRDKYVEDGSNRARIFLFGRKWVQELWEGKK